MSIQRVKKIISHIGAVTSVIGAILLFIKGFSPQKIDEGNLDFVFAVVKNGLPEIFIVLGLGLLLWKVDEIKSVLIYKTNYKRYSDRLKLIAKSTLLFLVLLFVLLSYSPIYYFLRARYYHYANLDRVHRYYLYESFCVNVNDGEFSNALKVLNKLTQYYPEEEYRVTSIKNGLEMRINNSNRNLSLANIFVNPIGNSVTRNNLNNLLKAYSLAPNESNLVELLKAKLLINTSLNVVISTAEKYKIDKKDQYLEKLIDEYSWLIFEEGLMIRIAKSKAEKIKFLEQLMNRLTIDEFKEIYSKYWYLEDLTSLENWKRNVSISLEDNLSWDFVD